MLLVHPQISPKFVDLPGALLTIHFAWQELPYAFHPVHPWLSVALLAETSNF